MARDSLISDTRFSSYSRGRGSGIRPLPIARGFRSAPEEEPFPIPLDVELAFERRDLPGRSYADVVKQAIEKVSPGSAHYSRLLREYNQAIIRQRQEAEAEQKAREKEARSLAAAGKKEQTRVLKEAYSAYQLEDLKYEVALRAIDTAYQYGLINGQERDSQLLDAYNARGKDLTTRQKDILAVAKQGITSFGGQDVELLYGRYEDQLSGGVQADGTVKPGLTQQIISTQSRINNPGAYSDLVQPKTGPYGSIEGYTIERIQTPIDTTGFIKDEMGRLIPLQVGLNYDEKGNSTGYLYASVPRTNADGTVTQVMVRTNKPINGVTSSTKAAEILRTTNLGELDFRDVNGRPVYNFIDDRFTVGGLDLADPKVVGGLGFDETKSNEVINRYITGLANDPYYKDDYQIALPDGSTTNLGDIRGRYNLSPNLVPDQGPVERAAQNLPPLARTAISTLNNVGLVPTSPLALLNPQVREKLSPQNVIQQTAALPEFIKTIATPKPAPIIYPKQVTPPGATLTKLAKTNKAQAAKVSAALQNQAKTYASIPKEKVNPVVNILGQAQKQLQKIPIFGKLF